MRRAGATPFHWLSNNLQFEGCCTGSSHFGVYGVWLEVGLDGLSESAGVQQASSDVVVEVAEAEGYAP